MTAQAGNLAGPRPSRFPASRDHDRDDDPGDAGESADDGGEGDNRAPFPQPRPPALLHRLLPATGNGGVLPGGDGIAACLHGLAADHAGIRPAAAACWEM